MTLFNNIEIIIATAEVIEKPTGNRNFCYESGISNGLMYGRSCHTAHTSETYKIKW